MKLRNLINEIDDETIIRYRDKDGNSAEMKASSAKTMSKDHPAKIAYDSQADKEGTPTKKVAKGDKVSFDRKAGGDSAVSKKPSTLSVKRGLEDIVKGNATEIEGIPISKDLADGIQQWIRFSPYGKTYGKQLNKARFSNIIRPANAFNVDRYLTPKAKKEFKGIVKSMKESKSTKLTDILSDAATPKSAPEYFKGLSAKDKKERERVIARRSKMKSNDPDAYKPFRSDKGKKTKPSSSTLKFKKMFGELNEEEQQLFAEKLSAKIRKSLKKKAEKANAPMGALTTIYNKGLAAWRTGHRPGASQHAWAMARVNSVLTGGKARKVDAAQWKQISKHRKKKKK